LAGKLELIEPLKAPSCYFEECDTWFPEGCPATWRGLAAAEMKGMKKYMDDREVLRKKLFEGKT
jgi:hypothetical protein